MDNFTTIGNFSGTGTVSPILPPNSPYFRKFDVDAAIELAGYIDLPGLEGINVTGAVSMNILHGNTQIEGVQYSVVNDALGVRRRLTWNPAIDPTLTTGLMDVLIDGQVELIEFLAIV